MTTLDFIMLVLASQHLTSVTRNGEIFAPLRSRLEAGCSFFGRALQCGFCWSHWMALVVVGVLWYFHMLLRPYWTYNVMWLTIVWLAVVRAANMLHDLVAAYDRTPKADDLEKLLKDVDNDTAPKS